MICLLLSSASLPHMYTSLSHACVVHFLWYGMVLKYGCKPYKEKRNGLPIKLKMAKFSVRFIFAFHPYGAHIYTSCMREREKGESLFIHQSRIIWRSSSSSWSSSSSGIDAMLVVVFVLSLVEIYKYLAGTYTSLPFSSLCTLILLFLSHSSYFNRKHLFFCHSIRATTSTNFSSVVVILTTMHFTYITSLLPFIIYLHIYLSLCKASSSSFARRN